MRILVFDSTTQLNAHIIYAMLLTVSQIMIGMVFVLVSVLYANGNANEHTPWNFETQNHHSATAIIGLHFLLSLGMQAHNRTDGWSSSMQNIARLISHVLINMLAIASYLLSIEDSVEMTGGRHEACGRSQHCKDGWVAMYFAGTAFLLGPFAAIINHACSVLHAIFGMMAFIWCSMSAISGINADIYHRARFIVFQRQKHTELGRLAIVLIYIYTPIVMIYPCVKAFRFCLRIKDAMKWIKGKK